MFKVLKGIAPNCLKMLFHVCNNTSYPLRTNNLKMSLPKPKTDFLKKSFAYRGAAFWNKLPSETSVQLRFIHVINCSFKE